MQRDRGQSNPRAVSLDYENVFSGLHNLIQGSLTHIHEVAVVPRHEVAEGRQLVGHVEDMLAGCVASTNPDRL